MVYIIVFDYIAITKNLLNCNNLVNYKSFANYSSYIIQKFAIETIIVFIIRKITISNKRFEFIMLLVH